MLDGLLAANAGYADARSHLADGRPDLGLAVVTCMDTRIDVLAAFGLHLGEALIVRNAGARVTEDVVRSLALASHVLGVHTVALVQHTRCGLYGVDDTALQALTGSSLAFLSIRDHTDALRDDVDALAGDPALTPIAAIAGLLYDVDTGAVDEVVRWHRS